MRYSAYTSARNLCFLVYNGGEDYPGNTKEDTNIAVNDSDVDRGGRAATSDRAVFTSG